MFKRIAPILEIWGQLKDIKEKIDRLDNTIEALQSITESNNERTKEYIKEREKDWHSGLVAYFISRDKDFQALKDTVSKLIDARQ